MTELRKPVPYNQAWGTRHKRKTKPFAPGEVLGLLTVVEQFAPGSKYTRFRCQCGEEMVRLHSDVQKSLNRGCRPGCHACNAKARAGKVVV